MGISNDGDKDLLLYAKKKVIDSLTPEFLIKTYAPVRHDISKFF
jgi:hypothetical protein